MEGRLVAYSTSVISFTPIADKPCSRALITAAGTVK
jgi:hypothetical protein